MSNVFPRYVFSIGDLYKLKQESMANYALAHANDYNFTSITELYSAW
jgi:hypothetical protein